MHFFTFDGIKETLYIALRSFSFYFPRYSQYGSGFVTIEEIPINLLDTRHKIINQYNSIRQGKLLPLLVIA